MDTAEIVRILTAEYPVQIWFVPSIALAILALTSFIDARTGRIPDLPIVIGLLGTLCSLAWYAGWLVAGQRFAIVFVAVAVLRLSNSLYYKLTQKDAVGFGDAKWSALAVAAFDYTPVIIAWVIGAWIGVIWLAIKALLSRFSNTYNGEVYVHFAPFLLFGLIVALFRAPILAHFGLAF